MRQHHKGWVLTLAMIISVSVVAGCAGAVRSENITALVATEADAIDRLSKQLAQAESKINAMISILKDVRGTSGDDGFLHLLDQWTLAEMQANFLTEELRGSPADPDIRRAALIKLAGIRETHEKAEKVLARSLADADETLIESYSHLRTTVDGLRNNLKTVKRYTESSKRKFFLNSVDVALLGTIANEIDGADQALAKAGKAISDVEEVLSLLGMLSSSSTLTEAQETATLVNDTLNRISAASGS